MDWYRRWAGDAELVSLALILSLGGIAMIFSAGVVNVPSPVTEWAWFRQTVWLAISLAVFTCARWVGVAWIESIALPAFLLAVLLLALSLVIGTGAGTAEGMDGWIEVGPIRFQPSELAKIAAILGIARVIALRDAPPEYPREILAPGALIAVLLALVIRQPDLGTALAFIGLLFAVLYWAGTPVLLLFLLASPGFALILSFDTRIWSVYFIGLVLLLIFYRRSLLLADSLAVALANLGASAIATPLWNSLAEYQKNRLLVFLDPAIDPRGAGWNLIQSKVAIGSGGLLGKGFTQGTQKRLDFLPEQHTDFIFSVVGEELGFIGAIGFILLFALLLLRLVRLAEANPSPFAGLVLFGIFGTWLVHIFINVGMTVGLVPITGIPLPFVSYGGTFLLTCWTMTALAVRLAGET